MGRNRGTSHLLSLLVPFSMWLCACIFWGQRDCNICDRANILMFPLEFCCSLQLVRSRSGSSTGRGSAASMDPQARFSAYVQHVNCCREAPPCDMRHHGCVAYPAACRE